MIHHSWYNNSIENEERKDLTATRGIDIKDTCRVTPNSTDGDTV